MQIRFEPSGAAPLYKQLADTLHGAILRGEIARGERLPTVRELAARLGLSVGTAKRAYEELSDRGAVRLVQGSGTFADWQEAGSLDRKERATAAIDAMLDTLEELRFSPREIRLFLELKLRERWERFGGVRVALVDDSSEALAMLSDQLAALEGAELYPVLLSEAPEALVPEELDLIAAPEEHFDELCRHFPAARDKLFCFVAGPTRRTAAALGSLDGCRVGVAAAGERFTGLLLRDCARYAPQCGVPERRSLGGGDPAALTAGLDALVAPECYRRLCGGGELAALTAFARGRRFIKYEYRIDRGSLLSLQQRVKDIAARREE